MSERVISWRRVARYFALMGLSVIILFVMTLPILPLWLAAGCPSINDPEMRKSWDNLKQAAWDLA